MNTKTFAQQARNILMKGVANKLLYWGFNEAGEELTRPESVQGGYMFRGEAYDDTTVPKKWNTLKVAIKRKGIEQVVEEAAYTWFNRMMAIRILAKNGHEQAQLEYISEEQQLPVMVQRARRGQYDFLPNKDKARLQRIITDFSKENEAFAQLLVGYCTTNTLLKNVFGSVDDYTEILLPDDILSENGFLHLLNTTDAIADEDYQEVELIGWLYQFYISERKDEVFASFKKKKKAEAKDIPAATQIFTPNWIVKYMVQNTVGKLWLDLNPDSKIKGDLKYLVEGENPRYGDPIIAEVANIKLLDPACGSGHILVEGFDLLYQMYMEEYYPPQEAVESILKNNLFGLDIDDRAMQLARFAVLLKAAKHYPNILKAGILPHIYAMPAPRHFAANEIATFLGEAGNGYEEELTDALKLMYQAKNLGSTMQLEISEGGLGYIRQRLEALNNNPQLDLMEQGVLIAIRPFIQVLFLLCQKYEAVVANPPYMGQRTMNLKLKEYINTKYSISKTDLFSVFIEVMLNFLKPNSRVGCITMESWMFLSSYESLRQKIINEYSIVSLTHLGWHIIGIAFGTTAFILEKSKKIENGEYSSLSIEDIDNEKKIPLVFPKKDNGRYALMPQRNFLKIPSAPIAYWVSAEMINAFAVGKSITSYVDIFQGIITGNNERFLRYWTEVSLCKIPFETSGIDKINLNKQYWIPYNKGGTFRKWYGIQDNVVFWKYGPDDKTRGKKSFEHYYLRKYVAWSYTVHDAIATRYYPNGFLWDVRGSGIMDKTNNLFYLQGLIGSIVGVTFFKIVNSTISCQVENIIQLPIIINLDKKKYIEEIVIKAISISKMDWDSYENSWNFSKNPLLSNNDYLEQEYQNWSDNVKSEFFNLQKMEEELNSHFINIYNLQEELTPEVRLKDITILQEELDSKALEALEPTFREQGKEAIELPIKKDVVMQQLISYALGIFMGRYRLDQKGLQIAHPNPSEEEIAPYTYNGHEIEIDEDAIIPLMGSNSDFPDDALNRFKGFLDAVWGEETRIENLNFLQDCLNMDLEKYFLKHFWKDHCKRYKKKPIYWLFSSKKGAFQVLVYMHRMNAFTVEKIRANYLMPHLKTLRTKIDYMEADLANLDKKAAKELDKFKKDLLECEGYDMELKEVADQQIAFDLDDGVTVNYAKFGTVVAKIK